LLTLVAGIGDEQTVWGLVRAVGCFKWGWCQCVGVRFCLNY
jgi:hypothetical protein